MKIGALLQGLTNKIGNIELTDELKAIFALDADVPNEVAKKIETGLLTLEAAKTNPEITRALKQSTLAGVDAKLDEIIKEQGVTVGEDYLNERNTYEKVAMIAKGLVETGKRKAEGQGKESVSEALKKEREEFARREADYNAKLKGLSDTLTAKETEYKTTREADLTNWKVESLLGTKDYSFPKEMDVDLKVLTAKSAINKDLQARGLKIVRNEAGVIQIVDKDGQKAYNEKHEAIDDSNSYFDGILSRNKMLNIVDPNAAGQQRQQQQNNGAQFPPGQKNLAVLNEIDSQIKAMG